MSRKTLIATAYILAAALSVLTVAAHWQGWLPVPLDTTDLLAFVTGLWSVWLAARNNPWNWPVGVANAAFFVALFWSARLYFDMGLNVFYVVSGLWGWWIWLFGGANRTEKPIESAQRPELVGVAVGGVILTFAMWHGGILIDDAAPAIDAVTTALSIVAQWLLMRRLIENWYFWIAADLIYVPLYLSRGLPLTAALYALFPIVCWRGIVEWRAIRESQRQPAVSRLEGVVAVEATR